MQWPDRGPITHVNPELVALLFPCIKAFHRPVYFRSYDLAANFAIIKYVLQIMQR